MRAHVVEVCDQTIATINRTWLWNTRKVRWLQQRGMYVVSKILHSQRIVTKISYSYLRGRQYFRSQSEIKNKVLHDVLKLVIKLRWRRKEEIILLKMNKKCEIIFFHMGRRFSTEFLKSIFSNTKRRRGKSSSSLFNKNSFRTEFYHIQKTAYYQFLVRYLPRLENRFARKWSLKWRKILFHIFYVENRN